MPSASPGYHLMPDELSGLFGVEEVNTDFILKLVNFGHFTSNLGWTFQVAMLPDLDLHLHLPASKPADKCCCKQTTRSND